MSNLKKSMLLGTCLTLTGLAGTVTTASAAVTKVYGGGASLPATYARQAMDCYGVPTDLVVKAVPPQLVTISRFNYTGTPAFNCATTQATNKFQVVYISTGSGGGINGVFSHDPSLYGDTDPNTAGNQFFPSVQYGLSETSLDGTDTNAYNNGGGGAGTHVGVTVQPPGGGAGTYPNPKERYGALIQFPLLISPVTVAYDPVYKKVRNGDGSVTEYTYNLVAPRADGSGGLKLDRNAYCKIFNGQITNWNDPALKTLNGNQTLKDPDDPTAEGSWSVPLQIAGRNDSSGTTSLFTRHIAKACESLGGNAYANSTSTLPASLRDNASVYNKTLPNDSPANEQVGKFTTADQNDGVAKYLDFTKAPGASAGDSVTQGRIGYVGADYALPGAINNPSDPAGATYALHTASLKNAFGRFVAPSVASATAAFGVNLPPQSFANGQYDAGSADPNHRDDPADWVQAADKSVPLADPTPKQAYPIVGTSNFIGYTCMSSGSKKNAMVGFLNWYTSAKLIKDTNLGLLAKAGLVPLPKAWARAIAETFVNNQSGLNLNIGVAGTGNCTGITPGA